MVKKSLTVFLVIMLTLTFTGCGVALREINERSQGTRTDVFSEVSEEAATSPKFADIIIKASMKTHPAGYYIEPESSRHGKSWYPFVLNIDGQAVVWKVTGQEENTPVFKEGKRTTEGGPGSRYILNKKIRLSAGAHTFFLGLPQEEYYNEVRINFEGGKVSVLEYKPIYEQEVHGRPPSYIYGVKRFEVFLNGAPVKRGLAE